MAEKFQVYEVALEMVAALRPSLEALVRRNRDLTDQVRRASSSVVLNIAEGTAMGQGSDALLPDCGGECGRGAGGAGGGAGLGGT